MQLMDDSVEVAERNLREQRERMERQIELIRHRSEEGLSIDREEAFLRGMQGTLEQMRLHLETLLLAKND